MTRYGDDLPQLNGGLFLTDGGLETTLIFHDGIALPHFAAFTLLGAAEGKARLRDYYRRYAGIARAGGHGFVLESPTWRASRDWGDKLGYSADALAAANGEAIALLAELRSEFEAEGAFGPIVLSGQLGPRGDGYDPGRLMTADEAEAYHAAQIAAFARAGADQVGAQTINNTGEAIGIARACQAHDLPVAISFTVETDGRLPTGETLGEAIEAVDAATGASPAYYMINCAHPEHFAATVDTDDAWTARVRGVRANASRCSHAELDEATELDDGDPVEFGTQHRDLLRRHPHITVFGGCCGTDHRHVAQVAQACAKAA
jgi:S-methylmethionine-dependent homocysteine/selenocysteine methylase